MKILTVKYLFENVSDMMELGVRLPSAEMVVETNVQEIMTSEAQRKYPEWFVTE